MNKRQIMISIVFVLALLSITILAACGSSNSSASAPVSINIDPPALMDQQCARCHPLSRVTSKTKTADQWKATLDRMIMHGAQLTSDQEQALVQYLAQNY